MGFWGISHCSSESQSGTHESPFQSAIQILDKHLEIEAADYCSRLSGPELNLTCTTVGKDILVKSSELPSSSPDMAHEMRVSWYKTVHSTTLTSPDRLDRKSLKTAISTLTILLDLAPTALDYVVLQSVLSEFRDELSERVSVLKLVERAPP